MYCLDPCWNTKIDYDDFMSKKNILNIDTIEQTTDGFNADIITYTKTIKIVLTPDNLKKYTDSNYYYEYVHTIDENIDIIDNIKCECSTLNFEFKYLIGGISYDVDEFTEFIAIASRYYKFEIYFNFSEIPTNENELYIHFRCYKLGSADKKKLESSTILTKTLMYSSGMADYNMDGYYWKHKKFNIQQF